MYCILPCIIASFCCFAITRADVLLPAIDDFTVDIADTVAVGGASVTTTVDNEIDDIVFGWNNLTRTPAFTDFYDTEFVSVNPQLFVVTLSWKTDTTHEERKQAGGEVICKAVSGGITLKSTTFVISVAWKPEPSSLTLEFADDDIFLGSSLTLRCSSPDKGNPPGLVKWVVDGDIQSGGRYNNDNIVINPVEKTDAGDWKCYYGNDIGNGTESETKNVDVKWKPEPSSLMLEYAGDDIILRSSLTLRCSSPDKGNPPGSVKWIVDGDTKSGGRYNNENITINSVEKTDAGEWKCYYGNGIGMGPESETKTVDVKWPPGAATLVIDGVDDNSVKQGQQITFKCTGDAGNPLEQVLWIFDTVINKKTSTTHRIFHSEPRHNGTWSCMFMNQFGNGTVSKGVKLTVLLTPLPPRIELINSTTNTLTISIEVTPNTDINTSSYNHTTITLSGNGETVSEIQPADIVDYTCDNLEPLTLYNISVFYVNDIGDGQPALQSFTTKNLPVLKTPTITRRLLDAGIQMTIENPDSATEIKIEVCKIGETDSNNCNKETINLIEEGDFDEAIYGSFSERNVNVTMYDNGVQVFSYQDNIGPAVVVIALLALTGVLLIIGIVVIIIVVIKKKDNDKKRPDKAVEENIDPYTSYSNPNSQSRTGTGPAEAQNEYSPESKPRKLPKLDNAAPPVDSMVNRGKSLAPIVASQADGDVYSQVDWSKKTKRPSLKGSPMSKKAIDKIMFSRNDGYINMQFEVSKKFAGDIDISVCLEGDQSCTNKVSKQHVRGTKNVVMVLPIEETSKDKYAINMKFIMKGQMVQEVDLTYPYEHNAVHVTVMNDAYVTSGTGVNPSEMPEYSEVNKSKKTKGSEMPIYSEVNKPKKKKKAAEEQPYEDVETKNQSSHNERSTNAVSPSNAEVAVEGVTAHPPRKGTTKEGVMYAELDLNSSGAPRLLPRLGSKSPAHEPVVYADVRPG